MSSNLYQLTADAMKLPLRDRVQLAQRLVSTLDDEVETGVVLFNAFSVKPTDPTRLLRTRCVCIPHAKYVLSLTYDL